MPKKKNEQAIRVLDVKALQGIDLEKHEGETFQIIELPDFSDVTTLVDMWDRLKEHGIEVDTIEKDWLTEDIITHLLELRKRQKSKRVKKGMKASGKSLGRPAKRQNKEQAALEYMEGNATADQIAQKYGISRTTLYRELKK